jgi:hypothetical protein
LPIILKTSAPANPVILQQASLCTCFAVVVILHKLYDPWSGGILRIVCKKTWEILDELRESVPNAMEDKGDKRFADL